MQVCGKLTMQPVGLWPRSADACAVNEEQITPAVVIEISDGDAISGHLEDVFLRCDAAVDVGRGQSYFGCNLANFESW